MTRLRLMAALTILALSLSACAPVATPTPTPVPTQPPAMTAPAQSAAPTQPAASVVLKLEGTGGTKSLTLNDLKALPATEGWAGIKSSTGKITVPERFKGVAISDLCQLVGGLDAKTGVSVVAKDGYAMTISYDQITKGDFITYDPGTGDEIKAKDPLKVILAYEKEGKPLPEDSEGTLRLVVVTPKNNQVVDGHWSVKWITQVAVKSLAEEWKLALVGVISEEMDRGTFQSCTAPACHGAEWKDDKAQTWKGVPLWMLAARVDDETKHGDNAFNQKLAEQGYTVEVTAADGYKVTLESARLMRKNNFIVAYLVNGNPLDDKYFPLRLVSDDLQTSELIGKVAKITIRQASAAAPTVAPTAAPKPTETPKPQPTQAPAGAGGAALTVTGAVDKELSLTLATFKGLGTVQISAEHPKQGMKKYEGVRLSMLLEQAKVKAGATKLALISGDGYTVELSLADVRQCADCLIAVGDDGKLGGAMPGMQSNFWAKDVVKLEAR